MPKIALIGSTLKDGNSVRGVGYYTRNLYDAIQTELKTNPNYKNLEVDLVTSDYGLRITDYGLLHYPFFDPFFLTLKPPTAKPFLVTVHDLIPIEHMRHFYPGIKGYIRWLIQKHHLKLAKYLITVSHTSKYVIHKLTKYPLDKIYTTYEASPPFFYPLKDRKYLIKIKNKYNLPNKFVLYTGSIDWSKNIPTLVKACEKLNYPLVIIGKSSTQTNVPVDHWTADLRWVQSQKFPLRLGFVPDEDINAIYNLATIYCQPSHAEGFGLPPLQALQAGCPVVYSDNTCMNEIIDNFGESFDSYNPTSLEKALKKLWTNIKLQQHYRTVGPKRAAFFSWQKTAVQTLAVYQLALINEP
ncbi:glycosyltransferase family 4 protein [Candidatus Shapirobacteria bacterium]|nr:glycosyltransferase family 4 protein [Candidatus Shapirobacteria bacterium]